MFFKKHKSELPPIARFKFPSPQGEPPEDPPNQYGNKSSKDVPPAKTQRIAPPCPQPPPTRIVKDGGTRIFHCEPPKGSKPKPPRRQYGDIGSIDNSELDILTKDNSITNTAIKLGQTLKAIQSESNSEELTATLEFLNTLEKEKEWMKETEKAMAAETLHGVKRKEYNIITKDEYILSFNKRFGGDKGRATESFNNIAQGYNFIFELEPHHFYSVDYINKLLER
jgi:hypothetical protein